MKIKIKGFLHACYDLNTVQTRKPINQLLTSNNQIISTGIQRLSQGGQETIFQEEQVNGLTYNILCVLGEVLRSTARDAKGKRQVRALALASTVLTSKGCKRLTYWMARIYLMCSFDIFLLRNPPATAAMILLLEVASVSIMMFFSLLQLLGSRGKQFFRDEAFGLLRHLVRHLLECLRPR